MVTYDARPSSFTQLVTTTEWEYMMHGIGGVSGVDVGLSNGSMVPSLDIAGRNIVIADGVCVIKGQMWRCDAPVATPIPAASSQNRIDRLVIRLTRGAATSATVVAPYVITGTPSGTPSPPAITQTPTGIWDIPVCRYTATSAGALSSLVDERVPIHDQWHDMRPLSGGFGTVANEFPPQYRFDAVRGMVDIVGSIMLPGSGVYNGVTFATLPPFYCPSLVTSWPVAQSAGFANTNNTGGFPRSYLGSTGGLQLNGISSAINGTSIRINGSYPLQGIHGLITS